MSQSSVRKDWLSMLKKYEEFCTEPSLFLDFYEIIKCEDKVFSEDWRFHLRGEAIWNRI